MKIPKDIVGENRLRDLMICNEYVSGKLPEEIISERTLDISIRRVQKILYNNKEYVNKNMGWSKSKRIMYLQRLAEKHKDNVGSNKGYLDIAKELRTEIEGEKSLIDQSSHQHITIVRSKESVDEREENRINATTG